MQNFIVLQDLQQRINSPRSIAMEKFSGGIKIFSEKATNAYLQISDYKCGFRVQFITSAGEVVDEQHLKFIGDKLPIINESSLTSSFSFRLRRSSQKCGKCYFFMVVSWITNTGTDVVFLVSSALTAYSKNTIFDQANDSCSFLSMSCFKQNIVVKMNEELVDLYAHMNAVLTFARSDYRQTFIVFQNAQLTRANHTIAVTKAANDIHEQLENFAEELKLTKGCTVFGDAYSRVYACCQLFAQQENVGEVIKSLVVELTPPQHKDEVAQELEFSHSVARFKGQLMKGSGM